MIAIEAQRVEFGYGSQALFRGFDLEVESGEFVGVLGPNGSGKSTLLRLLAGLLNAWSGTIRVLGRDISRMTKRELAKAVAVVPQESFFAFDYSVWDVVMMGRNPHLGRFERPGADDCDLVAKSLECVDALGLKDRSINAISGGEKQRVVLARALAQEPEVLFLDEPTSHLDIAHQHSFIQILERLNQGGKTIVFLSHDLNLASIACSRVFLLHQGKRAAFGSPERVLTSSLIRSVYGVEPILSRHPDTGRPQVMLPRPVK